MHGGQKSDRATGLHARQAGLILCCVPRDNCAPDLVGELGGNSQMTSISYLSDVLD